MEPALHDGDWCLLLRARRFRPGDVVVVDRPDRPGLIIVKRLIRRESGGWWVLGDNPGSSDDSRIFGAVPATALRGRLILRYRPLGRGSVIRRRRRPATD
ncbi:MAG: nickel-type superoxide dismutase maturation protease [Actinomycetota bacterium]|nr:MAG: nickel-type superoxide dismutase maturation protease [Actinomycetota bacterium]